MLATGKLVEPPDVSPVSFVLESFNVSEKRWSTVGTVNAMLEKTKFSEVGFRDAFIARSTQKGMPTKWVVKKAKPESQANITANLNLTNLQHTRKQVQTNAVARSLAMSFARKTPADFGSCFNYKKVYFLMIGDDPVTVEEFIPGSFTKYINNNGEVNPNLPEDLKRTLEKAENFVHYSYASTDRKMMVVDLQGVNYNLCDPEIATTNLVDNGELNFCAGNLSSTAIETFFSCHDCNQFCKMMAIDNVVL